MMRLAGVFVRRKRVGLALGMTLVVGVLLGLVIGPLFPRLVGWWFGDRLFGEMWSGVWTAGFGMLALGVLWIILRCVDEGRYSRLEKGEDAEVRAGQAIGWAITAPNCAVAHSVTKIAKVGDIDHLVATPVRVWVIETKFRKVPPKKFPTVLQRLADNSKRVRDWAPSGTPIRACLVLAHGPEPKKKKFDSKGETIVVHTPHSIAKELKAEAVSELELDKQVAWEVWKLGVVPESDAT